MKTIKYIHFHNNTDLPIMINSWVDGSNKLQHIKIHPNEKRIIHSSVGEWHLNSMFESIEDRNIWKEKGLDLNRHITIGTFRSNRSASGNYSWIEDEDVFECIFTHIENIDIDNDNNNTTQTFMCNRDNIVTKCEDIKGLITFSQKK